MTDLSEARKALESLNRVQSAFDVIEAVSNLDPHIPAILQCLQDAEPKPEAPVVRAW